MFYTMCKMRVIVRVGEMSGGYVRISSKQYFNGFTMSGVRCLLAVVIRTIFSGTEKNMMDANSSGSSWQMSRAKRRVEALDRHRMLGKKRAFPVFT